LHHHYLRFPYERKRTVPDRYCPHQDRVRIIRRYSDLLAIDYLTVPLRYVLSAPEKLPPQIDDALAEEGTNRAAQKHKQEDDPKDDDVHKKPRLNEAERRRLTKDEKKAQRGSNKGRRWAKVRDEVDLCWRFAGSGECDFGSECVLHIYYHLHDVLTCSRCRFSHDVSAYLDSKPKDIYFPSGSTLRNEPPFVSLPNSAEETKVPSIDFTTRCPVFEAMGTCRLGLKCRFLGGHVRKTEDGTVALVEDEEKKRLTLTANSELNFISPTAMKLLRTKKVGPVTPTNF
jgi:tRNA-dihydrouridine synthase 3